MTKRVKKAENTLKHGMYFPASIVKEDYMKKTLKCLGIIALAAVIGFSMAGCGEGGGGKGTAPTITTTTLPGGTVGTAYNQTLAATGDTPITWSIETGSLPDGLSLSAAGVISGTPTTENTFDFTVKAANAAGSGTKDLSIVIDASGGTGIAPTITTTTLPGGTVGVAYNQTLAATGDTPITWSINTGSLPGGLTLSDAGVISGTPTTANTFNFTVKAANAAGNDTQALSIVIDTLPFNETDGAANLGRIGPGSGIIFYYDADGFTVEMVSPAENYTAHYLEAAPTDTGTNNQWGIKTINEVPQLIEGVTTFDVASSADAAKIGNGRKDTALISVQVGMGTDRAAKICANLTTGGKNDWFLPSLGELIELNKQKTLSGINITAGYYWSSSQRGESHAWQHGFHVFGSPNSANKSTTASVRAIRAF